MADVDDLDLVACLEQQAEAEGVGHTHFARQTGMDPGLWSRVRRRLDGDRLGVAICVKIVARYPHLKDTAVRYLAGGTEVDRFDPDALELLEEAARIKRGRDLD